MEEPIMLSRAPRVVKGVKPSPCRHVLHKLVSNRSGVGKLFNAAQAQPIAAMEQVPVKKATIDYSELCTTLPKKMVHRGMSGFKEPLCIATDGRLGAGIYAARPFILNIAQFIHDPKSSALLSTSPDPHTVKEYMIGFQLISAKGAIASMCLPSVYIRPQTARHIDIEAFQYYQKLLNGQQDPGEFRRVEDIFDLAQGNNETTAILGATKEDDWRPRFDTDVHSIVLVQGAAGRLLKGLNGFIKAGEIETTTVKNPDYRPRIMSIEVSSTATAEGAMFPKQFEKMNERALKLGLIPADRRILTLTDASTLMGSAVYRKLIEGYEATEETMVLQSVPNEIAFGSPELIDYAASIIESNPNKKAVFSQGLDSTLQL